MHLQPFEEHLDHSLAVSFYEPEPLVMPMADSTAAAETSASTNYEDTLTTLTSEEVVTLVTGTPLLLDTTEMVPTPPLLVEIEDVLGRLQVPQPWEPDSYTSG